MLSTPLCDLLKVRLPIVSAPLGGGIAGPELAAAVSNAGGLGLLGTIALPPPAVTHQIRRTRELTDRTFGAGVVLDNPEAATQMSVCLEERVPVLLTFWGDPRPWTGEARKRGVKVVAQIGSVDEARAARDAGVDAVVAQGVEAGGHVRGTVALAALLPAVVEAVKPLPVIAAGGIGDGRAAASAFRLGAQAVMMGTRFLATPEAFVDARYKERILAARAEETVLTTLFDIGWPGAPHRVLRNRAVREWEAAGRPPAGSRPREGTVIGQVDLGGHAVDVPLYGVIPPMPGFSGDIEEYCLYAGESCSAVNDIRPAAEIVERVMKEAERALG